MKVELGEDISVLSNSPDLDSKWLKSESLSRRFKQVLQSATDDDDLEDKLFSLLEDSSTCGTDPLIAAQGGGKIEKWIGMENYSAIKIDAGSDKIGYGTRSHAIITIDFDKNMKFIEKDRNIDGIWSTRKIEQKLKY